MAKCIIFGALPVDKNIIKIHNDDFVIAADAGLNTLNEYGISPNLIIGDFDSFQGIIPTGDNVIITVYDASNRPVAGYNAVNINIGSAQFEITGIKADN